LPKGSGDRKTVLQRDFVYAFGYSVLPPEILSHGPELHGSRRSRGHNER